MSLRTSNTALALLALATTAAGAQYSTPVGSGAAKPKTLRATAVLEFTGSLEKPSASRLMPIAVWDGEHYQPAGLYLARPSPLAFDTGTQYELERSGDPVGLLDVRAAAQLHGGWIGLAKFQPEAPPPPPRKLKPLKQQPVLVGGKTADTTDKASGDKPSGAQGDRPTLHRKDDSSSSGTTPTPSSSDKPASTTASSSTPSTASSKDGSTVPAVSTSSAPADPDHPTLHRRTDSSDDTAATSNPKPASGSTSSSTSGSTSGTSAGAGSSTSSTASTPSSSDPDRPTLHRPTDSDSATAADKPTLHRHDDSSAGSKTSDNDPDRPTLHRASTPSVTSINIDPDRPHLRYGGSAETADAALPARLNGTPPGMQQIVAVSDATLGEQRPYLYKWASPDEAAKMQAALAAIAAKALTKPSAAATSAQFGPASRPSRATTSGNTRGTAHANHINLPATALVDEHFAAYELTFSGGATLVYSAHTAGEGAQRTYITLIAQPDFNGNPQVLLQQVARGDRLDETPAMQLVDAVDTDDDNRAELIFQLTGAVTLPPPENPPDPAPSTSADDGASSTAASSAASIQAAQTANAASRTSAAGVPEREFAIYRVADRKAVQVFTTGPLP